MFIWKLSVFWVQVRDEMAFLKRSLSNGMGVCAFYKKDSANFVKSAWVYTQTGCLWNFLLVAVDLTQPQWARGSRALPGVPPGFQSPQPPGHGCGAGPLFLGHLAEGRPHPGIAVAGGSPPGIKPAGLGAPGRARVCSAWPPKVHRCCVAQSSSQGFPTEAWRNTTKASANPKAQSTVGGPAVEAVETSGLPSTGVLLPLGLRGQPRHAPRFLCWSLVPGTDTVSGAWGFNANMQPGC